MPRGWKGNGCISKTAFKKKNLFTDAVQCKILAAGGLKHSSFTAGLRNPNQAVKLQRASGFLSVKLRYLSSGP